MVSGGGVKRRNGETRWHRHGTELSYRIVLLIGGLLFLVPAHGYSGPLRLWHVTRIEAWICVGLIALHQRGGKSRRQRRGPLTAEKW